MSQTPDITSQLRRELDETRARLAEAQEALDAIRNGEVDGLMVAGPEGQQVFTLNGAQEPYRLLIEQMSECALTVSPRGDILYANQTLARLLQTPLDHVIGAELRSFVIAADQPTLIELIETALTGASRGYVSVRAGDGSSIPLRLGLSRLQMVPENLVCIVATDLTLVRKREEEMRHLHADLEQRVKERTFDLAAARLSALNMMEEAVETSKVIEAANRQLTLEAAERVRSQEELSHAHGQLKQMFDHSPVVLYRLKVEGDRIVPLMGSPNVTRLLGFSVEETLTFNWWLRQLHSDDYERAVASVPETLSQGTSRTEYRLRHKEGGYRWVEDNRRLVRDSSGQPMELVGVWTDITERKKAEAALLESRQMLRVVLDTIPVRVFWKDADLNYEGCNQSFALDAGMSSPEEIVGKDDQGMGWAAQADAYRADDRLVMDSGKVKLNYEEPQTTPDGRTIWLRTSKVPLRDVAGNITGILGTYEDITERKRADAEREELHRQLVDVSRAAGMAEVATNVLHNVGNVLNSVNISTTVVADKLRQSKVANLGKAAALLREHEADLAEFLANDPKGEQLPGYLGRLSAHLEEERSAMLKEVLSVTYHIDHIKEIVAMQQNYARVSGVVELLPVAELVEDALRLNEGALKRHDVDVIREFEPVPPIHVEKHKVLQILVNLIRNAKYALDDGKRTDKHLTIRIGKNGGDTVKIAVMDDGIGIPPENLTRIFSHGFTTRKGGHGFGLHSGALTARELGGSLTAHSDGLGHGASFTLELPIQLQKENHEPDHH